MQELKGLWRRIMLAGMEDKAENLQKHNKDKTKD